ncbi:MAG: glycosyltransferase [Actinobacteria bacterium]|nr:glycosyltransferase [Actinomycetota bacterium]
MAQLECEHPEVDWPNFSAKDFRGANPDLRDSSDAALAIYFGRYGRQEGRPMRVNQPPPGLIASVARDLLGPDVPLDDLTTWSDLFAAVDDAVDSGFAPAIETILEEPDDRIMVVRLAEAVYHCVPSPVDVRFWQAMIKRRGRPYVVTSVLRFFARDQEAVRHRTGDATWAAVGADQRARIHLLGDHSIVVTPAEWHRRRAASRPDSGAGGFWTPTVASVEGPLVSVICSLYGGGDFIRPYLENITSQVGFKHHELIIIDAASPDGEKVTIREFAERFPNIHYHRQDERIGIYEAWNIGIELSRGRFLTNANLDDVRHPCSLDQMAAFLEAHTAIDVTYTDVLYSLEPHLNWEMTDSIGVRTSLPPITTWNLLEFNSPHCAPMWRRELHRELGVFDVTFRSAGDWEFWLRCADAGKRFHKLADPLIACYPNPEGMSTSEDTPSLREQWPIRERYRNLLLQPERALDPLREVGVSDA